MSILQEVSKYSAISLDTMDVEQHRYFEKEYGLHFVNATSNQAICLANWLVHPQNVVKAIETLKESAGVAPKLLSDSGIEDYVSQVIIQAIAVTGSLQLPGLKKCVLSQVLPSLVTDTEATYKYGKSIIEAYERLGVDKTKVIIKIPITWEGMQAARKLTLEGIQCLGTVCHSLEQAVLAAEAGCVAISPYVDELSQNVDPSTYVPKPLDQNYGYLMTKKVHMYYRAHGIKTVNCIAATMGLDVILALSGVDEMTVPVPALNKMVSNKVPEGVTLPGLKETYTKEEAGPEISFINGGKGNYEETLAKNPEAVKRIQQAIAVFMAADEKARIFVKNVLVEYGFV